VGQPINLSRFDFASSHRIRKHLEALEELFLIYKIPSFENPKAQPQYRIFDAGVADAIRGGLDSPAFRHDNLLSLVINEIYAQYEYAGKLRPALSYYRTRGGAEVDLIMQTKGRDQKLVAIECMTSIDIRPHRLRGIKGFLEKYDHAQGYIIAPVQEGYKIQDNLHVIPWDQVG
jgi:hypothetical protein